MIRIIDGLSPKAYNLIEKKLLYVYHIGEHETLPSTSFMDKFGFEYQFLTITKAK